MIPEFEKIYEEVRAELDKLDRYADRREAALLESAKSVAGDVRGLSRALRGRGEISKAWRKGVDSNNQLRSELSGITGDPDPGDAVARMRRDRDR